MLRSFCTYRVNGIGTEWLGRIVEKFLMPMQGYTPPIFEPLTGNFDTDELYGIEVLRRKLDYGY